MNPEPTFDRDGYPTDETLKRIRTWPATDPAGCLHFVRSAWNWPDYVTEDLNVGEHMILEATKGSKYLRFATGGWSGNESLLAALEGNLVVNMLTWRLSARGGLHIYEIPRWGQQRVNAAPAPKEC